MTTVELLEALRDSLAADDTLVDWCVANVGVKPTIQIDFDDQQEIESFPLISFVQISHDQAVTGPRDRWTVNGSVFVRNTAKVETTSNGCTLVTYSGRLDAEGLREQVLAAIYRAKVGNVTVKGEVMSHTYHPRYVSPFVIEIERPRTVNI